MKGWFLPWLGVVALGLGSCESRDKKLARRNAELLAGMQKELKRAETLLEEAKTTFGNVDEFTLKREEFLSFFSTTLHNLPEDAIFSLISEETETRYLSTLTIQNLGKVSIYGEERSPKSLRLTTVHNEIHELDIVLQFYDVPILEEEHADAEPSAEYSILRDVWRFEWKMMDGRTMEWSYDWDIRSRAPWRLELDAVLARQDEVGIYYFAFSPELELQIR